MHCYDPSEQIFELKDMVIGIDWGKNGDKAVQVTGERTQDGKIIITEIKELNRGEG